MRGRKPKPARADSKVITGVFGGGSVILVEPNWRLAVAADDWAERQAEIAADKWASTIADMTRDGTISTENGSAIEMLAVQWARWKLAEAHVAKHGPIVSAPRTGVPMQNPYLSVANAAAEKVLKIEAELGLPPSMRGRVTKPERAKRQPRAADIYLGASKP